MSRATRMTAFSVVLGLVILGVGLLPAGADGPESANGIVGISVTLVAPAVGAAARLVVCDVLPGSLAQAGGVQRGDEIVAIDGQLTDGKTLRDVFAAIRGDTDSQPPWPERGTER